MVHLMNCDRYIARMRFPTKLDETCVNRVYTRRLRRSVLSSRIIVKVCDYRPIRISTFNRIMVRLNVRVRHHDDDVSCAANRCGRGLRRARKSRTRRS